LFEGKRKGRDFRESGGPYVLSLGSSLTGEFTVHVEKPGFLLREGSASFQGSSGEVTI